MNSGGRESSPWSLRAASQCLERLGSSAATSPVKLVAESCSGAAVLSGELLPLKSPKSSS